MHPPAPLQPLSAAEKRVLLPLMGGYSDKLAAELLFLSPHTVQNHRKSICRKLNVSNISAAASVCLLRCLLSCDEIAHIPFLPRQKNG